LDKEEDNQEEIEDNNENRSDKLFKNWYNTCKNSNGAKIYYPLAIRLVEALKKLMFLEFYTIPPGNTIWHKG